MPLLQLSEVAHTFTVWQEHVGEGNLVAAWQGMGQRTGMCVCVCVWPGGGHHRSLTWPLYHSDEALLQSQKQTIGHLHVHIDRNLVALFELWLTRSCWSAWPGLNFPLLMCLLFYLFFHHLTSVDERADKGPGPNFRKCWFTLMGVDPLNI